MAWFRNHYRCARCKRSWTDEWSCMCDDDCPHCGARHMTPSDSEDLTEVIEENKGEWVVFRSPQSAAYYADYYEIGRFPTLGEAAAFVLTC